MKPNGRFSNVIWWADPSALGDAFVARIAERAIGFMEANDIAPEAISVMQGDGGVNVRITPAPVDYDARPIVWPAPICLWVAA